MCSLSAVFCMNVVLCYNSSTIIATYYLYSHAFIFLISFAQKPRCRPSRSISTNGTEDSPPQVNHLSIIYTSSALLLFVIRSLHGPPFAGRASLVSRKGLKLVGKYIPVLHNTKYKMHSQFVHLICTICKAEVVLKMANSCKDRINCVILCYGNNRELLYFYPLFTLYFLFQKPLPRLNRPLSNKGGEETDSVVSTAAPQVTMVTRYISMSPI